MAEAENQTAMIATCEKAISETDILFDPIIVEIPYLFCRETLTFFSRAVRVMPDTLSCK